MQVETYIAAIYDGSKVVLIPVANQPVKVVYRKGISHGRLASGYTNDLYNIPKQLTKSMEEIV